LWLISGFAHEHFSNITGGESNVFMQLTSRLRESWTSDREATIKTGYDFGRRSSPVVGNGRGALPKSKIQTLRSSLQHFVVKPRTGTLFRMLKSFLGFRGSVHLSQHSLLDIRGMFQEKKGILRSKTIMNPFLLPPYIHISFETFFASSSPPCIES
jgi:hypothetical protein